MVEVVWRRIAQKQRIDILQYGKKAFGTRAAQKLYETIRHCEELLAANPQLGAMNHFWQIRG